MATKDQKLADAQRELAGYDPDEELIKALGESAAELRKGGAPAPSSDSGSADADQDGDGDENDEPEGDEGDEDEDDGDESEGDEDEDDGDEPAPPPAKKAPPQPLKRSRHNADESAEDLLKSLLLEPSGQPKPVAEVIEVSDVLTEFADTIAKSYGDQMAEIGAVQLVLDELVPLVKAMGRHMIAQGKQIRALEGEITTMAKSVGATNPNPGMAVSMKKRMPAGDGAQPQQPVALSKSIVGAGLQVAFSTNAIDADQYRQAAGVLDSQGVEAALSRIPVAVADEIRKHGSN